MLAATYPCRHCTRKVRFEYESGERRAVHCDCGRELTFPYLYACEACGRCQTVDCGPLQRPASIDCPCGAQAIPALFKRLTLFTDADRKFTEQFIDDAAKGINREEMDARKQYEETKDDLDVALDNAGLSLFPD